MSIEHFLKSRCVRDPAARIKLRDLANAMRSELSEDDREAWTRTRLIAELVSAGFAFGADKSGTTWVVGLALKNPPMWTVKAGRVEQATNG